MTTTELSSTSSFSPLSDEIEDASLLLEDGGISELIALLEQTLAEDRRLMPVIVQEVVADDRSL